jgi:hypothetical protein
VRPSSPWLVSLAVAAGFGLAGGSSVHWLPPATAWNVFVAAILWTAIGCSGTAIVRATTERLRRNDWRHGARLAFGQTLPHALVFLSVAVPAGAPLRLSSVSAVLIGLLPPALLLLILLPLSSPFRRDT